ncbi:hypothetical protein OFR22_03305 [Brachyspira hyodysenteriae]|uniref:Uncharacterized protein n=1 Tax=Brachyspira hyodysenteriae ATCC 27164 TaxID=1266923 RepID=A0A3B6VS10_BRAHO|nr:hypothetical protein [Brachyspira hyodysenteriae]ANN63565.1 hypothetical protein BHYOB78_06695 [Brachyspira hyodysenteriae ATCC 27164]AUJ50080.1 hypothetical protein BH718_01644 [Brachyspira hyodysenteriae]KLI17395.1 hypothetical protein SU44_03870 [Brachyspira hyodysenteriae]KLI18863.1 hypothetical protein SU45_00940 [Brachyspira hyodysenteriae]KLI19944.1 hypothetical protein SU46_05175 [Brachyspira hyodysenteriae]
MPKYLLPQDELSRASDWISNFLMREGYHADYTIESLSEIDKFFKEKMNLVLERDDNRNFIFSISAYIGEVIRKKFNGHWELSRDIDLDDETIGIGFKNHKTIYPLNITLELIQKKYTMKEYLKDNFGI